MIVQNYQTRNLFFLLTGLYLIFTGICNSHDHIEQTTHQNSTSQTHILVDNEQPPLTQPGVPSYSHTIRPFHNTREPAVDPTIHLQTRENDTLTWNLKKVSSIAFCTCIYTLFQLGQLAYEDSSFLLYSAIANTLGMAMTYAYISPSMSTSIFIDHLGQIDNRLLMLTAFVASWVAYFNSNQNASVLSAIATGVYVLQLIAKPRPPRSE